MKKLINFFNRCRNQIVTETYKLSALKRRHKKRTYIGIIRGFWSFFLGRVEYVNEYRPLILGSNIDYDIWSKGKIVLVGEDNTPIQDPANYLYPKASSIGVNPHFEHMNVSMGHPTRLRIKTSAKLILEPNTCILTGCYFAIAPEKELKIGTDTYIAQGVVINTWCGMSIGKNVMIGHESTIMDYDGHPVYNIDDPSKNLGMYGGKAAPIVIEDDVWIGFRVTILKGVKIGTGSIIAANSCITHDVPPNSIVAGNPAKVIKDGILWTRY